MVKGEQALAKEKMSNQDRTPGSLLDQKEFQMLIPRPEFFHD